MHNHHAVDLENKVNLNNNNNHRIYKRHVARFRGAVKTEKSVRLDERL